MFPIFESVDASDMRLLCVVVDVQKRHFTLKGISQDLTYGQEKDVSCETPDAFTEVLDVIKTRIPEDQIFYTDVNGLVDWRDQSERDLYLHI